VTDDPGNGSNDPGASRAARLAADEGEEVMRTGSLYRDIEKSRESRRTAQQHTNTPRLAEEIKYGTAKMGDITSTDRGIYFFEDQVAIAERRRVLMGKIHPKIAARKPIQRWQLKMNIPQNTSLECYDVVLSRCANVWHRLFTVTQPPQCAGQEEKSELPRMKPRFIFHIRGDFGNPSHSSLISVVFVTKAIAAADSVEPFQDRKVLPTPSNQATWSRTSHCISRGWYMMACHTVLGSISMRRRLIP